MFFNYLCILWRISTFVGTDGRNSVLFPVLFRSFDWLWEFLFLPVWGFVWISLMHFSLRAVVCFTSKTDIPYNQGKMKFKKLNFFMTYQVVPDLGGSTKLNLILWDTYSSCYEAKIIGNYPKNIWKMVIFSKSYTGQCQTVTLLIKLAPFLIEISATYPVFAGFCRFSCYSSLKYGKTSQKMQRKGTVFCLLLKKLSWSV